MSGAIFRTDLSWPAIVAFELGDFDTFRRPVYESPSGPGGIPLDIERALRSFEARFGSKARLVRVRPRGALASRLPGRDRGLLGTRRRHEDADRRRDPAQPRDLRVGSARHALAHRDDGAPPDRAARATTSGSRSRRSRTTTIGRHSSCSRRRAGPATALLTPLGAARVLGDQGTDASERGAGDRDPHRAPRFEQRPSDGDEAEAGLERRRLRRRRRRRATTRSGGRSTSPPSGRWSWRSCAGSRRGT